MTQASSTQPSSTTTVREEGDCRIAVDTLGGDHGHEPIIEGAVQACKDFGIKSILVGPEDELKTVLSSLGAQSLGLEIVHSAEFIGMDESPARAVRRKPDASMCKAFRLVKEGRASAMISTGNTGAMMAAGRVIYGFLPGIERPAIASIIPVVGDGFPNVLLDIGANVDSHAHNLTQFSVMGSIYYTTLFGVEKPRVGLLSNGTEPVKGNDVIRAAAVEMGSMSLINYCGFVEGRDIASDKVDVIVCDGFIGNIVLKSLEGCVRLIADQLRLEATQGVLNQIGMGLSRDVFRKVFREKFDHTAHGGAPLLGLKNLAVVLHGASGTRSVKSAIAAAKNFVDKGMTTKISSEICRLEESVEEGSEVSLLVGGNGS